MLKRHRFIANLLEVENLTPTVKRFRFETPDDFEYKAGMFMSISFQDEYGKAVGRSYSLSSTPSEKGFIEFCIKRVEGGTGTSHLFQMKPGDTLKMMGPNGNYFIPDEQLERGFCFIATGTGIAPFRGMIRELFKQEIKYPVHLITGVRSENEIIYDRDWRNLAKTHPLFLYQPTVSRPESKGAFKQGRIQEHLLDFLPHLDLNFYICGLKPMIDDLRTLLLEKKVSVDRLNIEQYD